MTNQTFTAGSGALIQADVLVPALFAIALGVFILFGTGFAEASALHNAAHDSRHSFAFPCH